MGNRRPEYLSGGWPGGPQSSGPGLFPQTCFRWRGSPLSPSVQIINEGNRGFPCGCLSIHQGPRLLYEVHKRFRNRCSGRRKGHDHSPGELASAIAAGDIGVLKSLPGIGSSRAKQIIAKLQTHYPVQHRNFGFFYPARQRLGRKGHPRTAGYSAIGGCLAGQRRGGGRPVPRHPLRR